MSISQTDRKCNSTPITPTPFDITIIDRNIPSNTHNIYDIIFDSNLTINTLITSSPSLVDAWFLETNRLHNPFPLLIGLDIEWRPNFQRGRNNRTAVLQLCINNRCLVFQIIHSPFIPTSLTTFLSNINNKFVGVGIEDDIEKLLKDYKIHVANFDDLRTLAAYVLNDREMLKTGIKTLSQRVLGKAVQKPKKVTTSKWDNKKLNEDQVKYATVDAFVSFEVGRRLYSNQFF
ncbi:3'-5' exonuclease-like [Cicer arietinum]|uniref:Werner Syndrome-like exonuclease n=1 Tax=Cicer arietinum TaxID=3827 RepID=A0A1S2Z3M9_CICAR|nr:Werner Syndrome-like exonuclease [Cicer arietinum]